LLAPGGGTTSLSKYTPTSSIYRLSLHDALPISLTERERPGKSESPDAPSGSTGRIGRRHGPPCSGFAREERRALYRRARPAIESERKSTRQNSRHVAIPHAAFGVTKKIANRDVG